MFKSLAIVSAVGISALVIEAVKGDDSTLQPEGFSLQPLYLQAATQPAPPETTATPAPEQPAPAPPPKGTLDQALTDWSVTKPLEDNGWSFGGWIEAGYTYDTTSGTNLGTIPGMVFNTDNNEVLFNQIELHGGRIISASKDKFDLGGFFDIMYGTDARYIHSNGLNWYGQNLHNTMPQLNPQYQVDLTQANLQFNLPVGNGIVVTAGKFVTLLGYETINPNNDPLYSHSYLFGFAIPFTNTGVIGAYNITDKLTITGGITRGWEQSTDDNNQSIDGIGQIKWVASDKLTLILNAISGPEMLNNNHDYTTVIDVVGTYALSDQLTLGINGDYGYGDGAAPDGGPASWYGIAGYAGYKLDSHLTFNGRLEWFNDQDGARGIGAIVYEATLGATITPFPNTNVASTFRLRPEVRYDWSADPVYNGQDSEFTVAIDALWSF